MSGTLVALTCSKHPALGVLVHYTPTVQVSASNSSECRAAHAAAGGQEKGVWANAVFGKFNDRGLGRGYLHFKVSRNARLPDLRSYGCHIDTIGRAAGFMALADVDVYRSIPPTCVKAYPDLIRIRPRTLEERRHSFLEENDCSSPFLPWVEAGGLSPRKMKESINAPIPACKSMLPLLYLSSKSIIEAANGKTFISDSSTFLPVSATYDVIRYCNAMMQVNEKSFEIDQEPFKWNPNELIAKAISSLLEARSQSWCQPGNFVEEWPRN
ncbi:hypothetical protein BCON_0073g00270 [Botryotinia convoluta]|uniref:Uncharacterized protein n=1 Tax=Botryotinia convoluta TaxID=54673 RepID=A0A4Z1IJG9_9HELO|nr:hypothetical protein BCON_0073g00270 [Botryotinia convoluta]